MMKLLFGLALYVCSCVTSACSKDQNYVFENFDKEMIESFAVFKGRIVDVIDSGQWDPEGEIIVTSEKRKTYLGGLLEVEPIEYFKGFRRTKYLIRQTSLCGTSPAEAGDVRIFFLSKRYTNIFNTRLVEPVSEKLLKLIGVYNEKET